MSSGFCWRRDCWSSSLICLLASAPSPIFAAAKKAATVVMTMYLSEATSRSWTAASLHAVSLVPPEGGSLRAGCRGPFPLLVGLFCSRRRKGVKSG